MKKSDLKKIIKEELSNILEAKFLKTDKLDTFKMKTNITVPVSVSVKVEKDNYDDGESTYGIRMNYDDRESVQEAVEKAMSIELDKKIKKHYKNEPGLKKVFTQTGEWASMSFVMRFSDRYKF